MDREDYDEEPGLGELPPPLMDERGEGFRRARSQAGARFSPPGFPGGGNPAVIPPPPTPPYFGDAARVSAFGQGGAMLPIVQPPSQFGVEVTYPAQPINSVKFNVDLTTFLDVPGDTFNSPIGVVEWEVPEGFIAVVREITWEPTNLLVINAGTPEEGNFDDQYAFTTVILRNGGAVPGQRTIVQGVNSAFTARTTVFDIEGFIDQIGRFNGYLLANPGDRIGLRFATSANQAGGANYVTNINANITGELLVDTGRELAFEPSNRII